MICHSRVQWWHYTRASDRWAVIGCSPVKPYLEGQLKTHNGRVSHMQGSRGQLPLNVLHRPQGLCSLRRLFIKPQHESTFHLLQLVDWQQSHQRKERSCGKRVLMLWDCWLSSLILEYSHDNDHDSSSTFLNDVNDFVIVRIVYSFNISFQIVTVLSSPVTVSSIWKEGMNACLIFN